MDHNIHVGQTVRAIYTGHGGKRLTVRGKVLAKTSTNAKLCRERPGLEYSPLFEGWFRVATEKPISYGGCVYQDTAIFMPGELRPVM